MSALCRFEMLLPLRFNDGSVVPREVMAETIGELEERFGAATGKHRSYMEAGVTKERHTTTNWSEFLWTLRTRTRTATFSNDTRKR